MSDIAQRFTENPLLQPGAVSPSIPEMHVECLLNPGVFRFGGKIWLLVRVAERPKQKQCEVSFPIFGKNHAIEIIQFDTSDPKLDMSDPRVIRYDGRDYLTTLSHLRLLCSEDGVHFREDPSYPAVFGRGELETYGMEDCRVVQIGDEYLLTFSSVSHYGVGVGLRSTRDWRNFEARGMIFPAHNKDCAIFDERIGGKYYALHRPSSPELGGNYIWIAESPDLEHWGHHRCIALTRPGLWDSVRIGAGASPIKTSAGWLEIYHGANKESRYCLGAMLLDLKEPWKVLARSEEPIMTPCTDYEQTGFFGNVVFTNGHLVDGDRITVYYGASDAVICGAHFSISEILKTLH